MDLYHLRNTDSSKWRGKETTCIKISVMILLNCQCAPVGADTKKRTVKEGSLRGDGTVPSTATALLFAVSPSSFARRSTCGHHAPALPKHLAWRVRGDRNPSAYYVAFHVLFFPPVSQLSWLKAVSEDFFAVFELVASAFLRAVFRLWVALPSLTSLFSNLKGISVHLELNFTATPFKVFDQNRNKYSVYIHM